MNDVFEGVFTENSINFTRVVDRLQKMFFKINPRIKICYVFGSDNYNFFKAFVKKGMCVCVERDNFEIKNPLVNGRIHYVKTSQNKDVSSTKTRSSLTPFKQEDISNKIYVLRDDRIHQKNKLLPYDVFLTKLKNKLNSNFDNIVIVDAKYQQELLNTINSEYINLDKVCRGGFKIDVSRIFHLSDPQFYSKKLHIANKKIPNLDMVVDDDISTGQTISSFVNNKNVKKVSLLDLKLKSINESREVHDVVDLRDFIFGSKDGGLLCVYKNKKMRVPYVFPFVNLETRAKIPEERIIEFSVFVLTLNLFFYKNSKIKVKELDHKFRIFIKSQGFDDENLIENVIKKIRNDLFRFY